MAKLSPARGAALALVSDRRRRKGRVRDMARNDRALVGLSEADRALAFRLALGTTAAASVLDDLIDARLKRPSSLEPRVRDALRVATYELCYLDTPGAVAVSQGVELVRSVSPRAAGLANAVLRRMVAEVRPQVEAARERLAAGEVHSPDLSLVSGLPTWLVSQIMEDRGPTFARALCLAQLESAPVFVAANTARVSGDELRDRLLTAGLEPRDLAGLPGSFALERAAELAATGMVERAEAVVCDLSAQLVCRLAAPSKPCTLLEIGQGRGTKSILLAAAGDAMHPRAIVGVDSVAYKVKVARRRMRAAGLSDEVGCYELDARHLGGKDVPPQFARGFGAVLLDVPCSGTGTMRRHPEIAANLTKADVESLAELQSTLLKAAASRVEKGGVLIYATCSVLRAEDEDVVADFLAGDEGAGFVVRDVIDAPICGGNQALAEVISRHRTPEGYFLVAPACGSGDGHFCACLVRNE